MKAPRPPRPDDGAPAPAAHTPAPAPAPPTPDAHAAIARRIDEAFARPAPDDGDLDLFNDFLALLNAGEIRAAQPDPGARHGWRVNGWVKRGILLGFRLGETVRYESGGGLFRFADKSTFPPRRADLAEGARVVPGGSAVREGAYLGRSVTCMPPAYVNVGARVDDFSMIDSHALVGSCAQIGRRCHISAGAQIGGVLEPVGALPVIVEDDVLVGGNCGVYEGAIVKRGAVLGAGVILTRSTPVYDVARGEVLRSGDGPLVVPEGAVVVPGARPVASGPGREWGLSLQAPVIVKYRDGRTGERIRLEELLR